MNSESDRYPLVEQTVRDLAESVDNNPLALLGIGAALGAVLGALVMWLLSRSSSGAVESQSFAPNMEASLDEAPTEAPAKVEDPNSLSAIVKRELSELLEIAVNEANNNARDLLEQQRGVLQQAVRETVRKTMAGQTKPRQS